MTHYAWCLFLFLFFFVLTTFRGRQWFITKKTCGTEHGIHSLIWFEELHQVYLHILTNKHIAVDSGLISTAAVLKSMLLTILIWRQVLKSSTLFWTWTVWCCWANVSCNIFKLKKYINITQIKSGSYILPRTSPHWKYWKISTSGRYFELEAAEPKVFLSGFFFVPAIP